MNIRSKILVAACLVAGGASVSANEVLVSAQPANGGALVSFDVMVTEPTAGFQFTLDHPAINEKSVDVSSCVSDLPAGLKGYCKAAGGKLGVIVFSPSAEAFSMGDVLAVGTVRIDADFAKSGNPSVSGVLFATPNGKPANGSGKLLDLSSSKPGLRGEAQK